VAAATEASLRTYNGLDTESKTEEEQISMPTTNGIMDDCSTQEDSDKLMAGTACTSNFSTPQSVLTPNGRMSEQQERHFVRLGGGNDETSSQQGIVRGEQPRAENMELAAKVVIVAGDDLREQYAREKSSFPLSVIAVPEEVDDEEAYLDECDMISHSFLLIWSKRIKRCQPRSSMSTFKKSWICLSIYKNNSTRLYRNR
jgi:hypothetical protein